MTCILHVYRAPNDKDFELYCHRNNHQLIVLLFCDFSYTKSTLRYLVWRIWDSNSWPIECKSIALTTELIPHIENDCSWDLPTVLWWVFQHTKTFLRAIRLSISYLDKRYANSSMTATGTFAQPCYKFETTHILLMNYKINVRL